MSVASTVSQANTIDWNVIAAAVAVFLGTLATTVLGALKARKELEKKLTKSDGAPTTVSAAILQDNLTVREATVVSRELRDQLLLTHHSTDHLTKAMEDNTSVQREVLAELRLIKMSLDRLP